MLAVAGGCPRSHFPKEAGAARATAVGPPALPAAGKEGEVNYASPARVFFGGIEILNYATGVNDAGVIVGNGTFGGQTRAFRLMPR